jgi:HEAT repeat protein
VDSTVRQALLEALEHDSNPGVRVEAVNLLVRSLEEAQREPLEQLQPQPQEMPGEPMVQASTRAAADDGSIESVIRALEGLQRNDPSRYVRVRSAAALREISARSEH